MRYFAILLLACVASTLVADDIGVALGNKAWLLLSEPLGAGPGTNKELHPYAGDPGFPAPNWGGTSSYAPTELWCFDAADGKYTRVTQLVTNSENLARTGGRRTLYAPFLIAGEPYVIHRDGAKLHDGSSTCQVLKSSAAKLNEGKKPLLDGVVLASADYLDSPVVSPDGTRVAFRAFSGKVSKLRIFSVPDWKIVAETELQNWGRPIWCANMSLCAVVYDRSTVDMRVDAEDPKPEPGKLTRIELAEKVTPVTLLEGTFPPDTYSRCVAFDASRNRIVVARQVPRMKDGAEVGKEIVVEERDTATTKEIARFDHFRGIVIDKSSVYVAGVRDSAADDEKKADRRFILMQLRPKSPVPESGDKDEVVGSAHREMSADGRGGLQDLGDGIGVMLEPALNPLASAPGQPQFLHTLNVLNWRECDSLRNPRVIQYLSAMARRCKEIDEFTYEMGAKKTVIRPRVANTLLGFDLDIKLNNKAIKNKKGRYLEFFESAGRKGAGRIRVEDNIGGNWTVYGLNARSPDGIKPPEDFVYDNTLVTDGKLQEVAAARAGMYEKLLGQIDSRRLLTLVGLELSAEKGGLEFSGRETWRDPVTGNVKRIWIFKRKGSGKNAATMGFIADAPTKTAEAPNAHPMLKAEVAFALSSNQVQSSILAFESSYVELPDLGPDDFPKGPMMLLPKVVHAYGRNDQGELEEQFSATLLTEFQHEKGHIKDGYVRCGYNVHGGRSAENFTELMMRLKIKKP